MSEESKTPDADYVHMGDGAGVRPSGNAVDLAAGLDDPNLSQEDKDMRLAIALQQQENAAVYDDHKKKHDEHVKAEYLRTGRSGTMTKLAAVRSKDHGMLRVPAEYSTENAYVTGEDGDYMAPAGEAVSSLKGALPQEVADHNMAVELQKVEQVGAGTVQAVQTMMKEEHEDEEAQEFRTLRSGHAKRF